MFRMLWYGLSAGLVAGSVVGAGEALYVLQASTPSEYQALAYGTVLYGLIGGCIGLAIGVALAPFHARIQPARAWTMASSGVACSLGFFILRYIVNKAVYAEQGVPMVTTLGLAGALGMASIVWVWIGTNILIKTPLRMIPTTKGTVVLWGGGIAASMLFSLAPAPGAAGAMAPKKQQAPDFAQKPDVILILVDTLRADALSVYGGPADASPALAAFAGDAIAFDQFITSASWTRASTASLMTSLSPSTHTCELKNSALPSMVKTLAEVMQDAGYVTGGLPNNANVTGAQGFGQGFDWFPYNPEYPLGAAESTYALSMYSLVRKVWTHIDTKKRVEEYYQPAEKQLARASEFIAANQGSRYFLFVHLMEPHDPYFTHPWTGEAYGRAEHPNPDPGLLPKLKAMYAGEVSHADAEIGTFLASLKADGRYDDALIIVTADHGEEFLEHGGWWHGTTLYDEQIRVPLLVKLPGKARAGTRVPWQVRQIDLAPTIAELAGLTPAPTWQGRMLFDDRFEDDLKLMSPPVVEVEEPVDPAAPVLSADPATPAPPAWTAPTWANHPASRDALAEQDFEGYDLEALRRGGKKVIEALRTPIDNARHQPPVQYYDLMSDPTEQHNLAGSGEANEAAMRAALDSMVEQKKSVAVTAEQHNRSAAETARLCALGYLSGPDCDSTPEEKKEDAANPGEQ